MKHLTKIGYLLLIISTPSALTAPLVERGSEDSIVQAAEEFNLPSSLLSAICWIESAQNPSAFVYGDGDEGNHAFGLCQLLYTTALDLGLEEDEGCRRDFRDVPEKGRTAKECALFDPQQNAYYAAKFLSKKLSTYDNSWLSAIAAYNSGTPRACPDKGYFLTNSYKDGKRVRKKSPCAPGELMNKTYVDKVLQALIERR